MPSYAQCVHAMRCVRGAHHVRGLVAVVLAVEGADAEVLVKLYHVKMFMGEAAGEGAGAGESAGDGVGDDAAESSALVSLSVAAGLSAGGSSASTKVT